MRRFVPPVPMRQSCVRVLLATAFAVAVALTTIHAQIPGRNVNMVSGVRHPEGDPFLQRQNEPSIAASTRNPLHLLGGSNDYRTVDLPGLPDGEETGDAWLGLFKSTDGGQRWTSSLLPGYPQDNSPAAQQSPLRHFQAGADAVVRAGTHGMVYYSGLVFDRAVDGKSGVFLARFIDNNNQEAGDPFAYLGTTMVAQSTGAAFLDTPWMAVDLPRSNAVICQVTDDSIIPTRQDGRRSLWGWDRHERHNGRDDDDDRRGRGRNNSRHGRPQPPPPPPPVQRIPAGAIYVAYSSITGDAATLRSEILVRRSMDCGATWSQAIRVSRPEDRINQGSSIAIDPRTGAVYIGYRRFDPDLTDNVDLDAIMVARLPFGATRIDHHGHAHRFAKPVRKVGRQLHRLFEHRANRFKTSKPQEVAENLDQFDLGTTGFNFRTNAYPTMTVDHTGRLYVAWTQRGFTAGTGAATDPDDGARIVISTTRDGRDFTVPRPVDDHSDPGRGHQLMPSMTYAGGKLMLVFYDLRETKAQTFNRVISDANTVTGLRHTIDIRSAMASPREHPSFAPSVKVSEYLMGLDPESGELQELQVNPPNLPMFKLGTVPFMGDYIDVTAAPAFIPVGNGRWAYNHADTGVPPVFHAAWTDNRDVRPPRLGADGRPDWTKYTPAQMSQNDPPRQSIFDPTQTVPSCSANPGNAGSRNQNVYSARIYGDGLLAGSPGNTKPLSPDMQRGFVVFAQNGSSEVKSYRMTILNQPPGGRASFDQFPLPPYTSSSPAPETAVEMIVPPRSMASRTVYVTSSNRDASVNVDVSELVDLRNLPPSSYPTAPEKSAGAAARVMLNPDIENPDIENPDIENPGVPNPDIENAEVYNPDIENPDIENPEIENPDIENPDIENPDIENPDIENPDIENPDIENVRVANPDIENPDIENPDIENPDIENPDIENPDIENPDIENGAIQDVTWKVTNTGNTTASFNVNLFLAQQNLPQGVQTQLVLLKTYRTPVTVPNGCELAFQVRNILVANIPNPRLVPPGGTPANPNDPAEQNATLWLAPGEEGRIVMRVFDEDTSNNVTITKADGSTVSVDPGVLPGEDVTPIVQQQAVDTEDAEDGVIEPPVEPPPAPRPTDDEAWTVANVPTRMNVLRNDAAVWGSTKIQTQHSDGVWQSFGGNELVYMPTSGLLYVGGNLKGVGVIDPVTRKLAGHLPMDPSDPPFSYGLASPQTGLLFFRSGGPGAANANVYAYDVRPGSPTFHQVMPADSGRIALIDALGGAFTFSLNANGTVLYYAAGTTVQQRVAAINVDPNSPGFASILWQQVMPANAQVRHVVENPATGKVYIASANSGTVMPFGGGVYVISGGGPPVRITGADQATSVAINSATNLVYAAGGTGPQHRLNAIDGSTDTLITQLPLVAGPMRLFNSEDRIVIHNGTGKVFLRSALGVQIYDGARGSPTFNTLLATVPVGTEFAQQESVVNQTTGVVATAGSFFNKVTLIDALTNAVQDIAVARTGGKLAFDAVSGRLFFGDGGMTVSEIAPAVVGVGAVNWSLALFPETAIPIVNPVTNRAYIGTADLGSSIDVYSNAGRVGPITGLTPAQGRWGFAARHHASNSFYFVNGSSNPLATQVRPGTLGAIAGGSDFFMTAVETIGSPFGIGVNQTRHHVYVAGNGGVSVLGVQEPGQIRVHEGVNLSSSALADTSAFGSTVTFGRHIEVLGDRAYVMVTSGVPPPTGGSPASVAFLDGDSIPGTHVAQPLIFPAPFTNNDRVDVIRVNPSNNLVYFGLFNNVSGQYNVVALDNTTHAVQATFTGGGHSRVHTASWLAVNPATNTLYVLDFTTDSIRRLDATTLVQIGTPIPLPDGPSAMALNLTTNRVYVASMNAKTLTALDGTSLAVLSTVKLPLQAFFLAVNESEGRIYTGGGNNQDESGIMVVSDVGGVLGTNVSITTVSTPGGGTAVLNADYSITYTPAPGFVGDDTFTYTTMAPGGSASATVTVHVAPVAANPIANPDSFATTQGGSALIIPAASLLANDANTAGALITIVTPPAHGSLIDSAVSVGGYDYVPAFGYSGPDSFQYFFTSGSNSNVTTVSLWVEPAASPLIVTNTNDSGAGSLRAAMTYANATPGSQTITFNIPGAGAAVPAIIVLGSALPPITESVTIDGTSQPGFDSRPVVEVSGNNSVGVGFQTAFDVNSVELRGLAVTRFTGFGVQFLQAESAPPSTGHRLLINYIGTDRNGAPGKGNFEGVEVRRDDSIIGGNVISGNTGTGLLIRADADRVRVNNNLVGISPAGNALGNGGAGITLMDSLNDTDIDDNFIAGNAAFGIDIQDTPAGDVGTTRIRGNKVGLTASSVALPNRQGGIRIANAPGTMIGEVGDGNVISGNANGDFTEGGPGITVIGSPSSMPVIINNRIGTDITGELARPNNFEGIALYGHAIVGGEFGLGRGNLISGNGLASTGQGSGIMVAPGANGSEIYGNRIGLNLSGTALGNGYSGITVASDDIIIGGTGDLGNLISGNEVTGIAIYPFIATEVPSGITIHNNQIGTDSTGLLPRPNHRWGITVDGQGIEIGGDGPGEANRIAFNGINLDAFQGGIHIGGNSNEITIAANSIHANNGLGIDLAGLGPEANDPGDVDDGPNGTMNHPMVVSAVTSGGTTTVSYSTFNMPGNGNTLHFYASPSCDASGHGEGQSLIATVDSVGEDTTGDVVTAFVAVGQWITATATDSDGSTSEFSPCVEVGSSALVVTNTNDSGAGSLRQAIVTANTQPGTQTITFNIPGAAPGTPALIQAASSLPAITEPVIVNGTSQPGYDGLPIVEIRSPSDTAGYTAFTLGASNVTIKGLSIWRFGTAILGLASFTGHTIEDNLLGTNRTFSTGMGNSTGIRWRADSSTIRNNVVSGNAGGMAVEFNATGNQIENNKIGVAGNGLTPLANSGTGVIISDNATANVFSGNMISANGLWGVTVTQAPANVFRGNIIGLDANGDDAGNTLGGIRVENSSGILIGEPGQPRNVISGNGGVGPAIGPGIQIVDAMSPMPWIRNNLIGLDPTGMLARPNNNKGIVLDYAARIGGPNANEGNYISGHTDLGGGAGIIANLNAAGTVIQGNVIGLNLANAAVPNGYAGITVRTTGAVQIGGQAAGEGNVLSGNGSFGLSILRIFGGDPLPSNTTVEGNSIGTDADGVPKPNANAGINVMGTLHVIGGVAAASNRIAHNGGQGVRVFDTATSGVRIRRNEIRDNNALGIDIDPVGPATNDTGDGDTGPNAQQNYPVLTSAVLSSGTDVTIDTTSFMNVSHDVDLFSVPSCDASGFGEGATYLGTFNITSPGVQTVNVAAVTAGWYVTATASGPNGTSEFSQCRQVVVIVGSIS